MAIRLINANSLRLESFLGDATPAYAILSHTWEQNAELSFQEMKAVGENPNNLAVTKTGYTKVMMACQQALRDGFTHVWVDTCCIDKTSSAELSEAINSMYRWYQKAEVCYALISDVEVDSAAYDVALPGCKWFTRGWCLQELIAPRRVEFFDVHWNHFGSKARLTSLISKITRIDEEVLIDNSLIGDIPVARKMSWAARRETTREEDMAYCLLGIFDINMPLLYGEGLKAFMRLQEEIIKTSNDLSIFSILHGAISASSSTVNRLSRIYADLFAPSPRSFINCANVVHTRADVHWNSAFALTNKGLRFSRAELQVDLRQGLFCMPLNCRYSKSEPAWIYLQKVGPSLYARVNGHQCADVLSDVNDDENSKQATEIEEEAYFITHITPSVYRLLEQADEYAIRVWSRFHHLSAAVQVIHRSSSSHRWDASRMQFLTKGQNSFEGYWKVFPSLAKRRDGVEGHDKTPSAQFYLISGLEHFQNSTEPLAWVRLCSSEDWRSLEKRLGIITNLNNVVDFKTDGCTSDQITLDANLTVSATIRMNNQKATPYFELELDLT